MDLAGVFAEPVIEWGLGGGEPDERGLQIVCVQVDDGEVSAGGLLDPDRLSGDPEPLARGIVGRLAFALHARVHRLAGGRCLPRKQGCGESNGLHLAGFSFGLEVRVVTA